jgi:hydroxymethylglutaryl-CoA reductase
MEQFHNHLFLYLDNIKSDTKPEFGKMSAQHMVEHLAGLYRVAIGKIDLPIFTSDDELPKRKAFLMSEERISRGIKVPMLPDEPMPLRFETIEIAVEKLKNLWISFNEITPLHFKKNHPVFGSLNYSEWIRALAKHNLHHLSQFNLV